jgi:7-carboxy-7-deazaguanine synthase
VKPQKPIADMKFNEAKQTVLKVVEIFYSIQGEGRNTGRAAVFVRLSNCNKDCWYCDTDWSIGTEMTAGEILEEVQKFSKPVDYPNNLIIWTGGEPTLQLTNEVLSLFEGYYNCIETNGTNPVPSKIEYICCSPKVSPEILNKNFKFVNEFRYPISEGAVVPDISRLPAADHYYVSPMFMGVEKKRFEANEKNINYCIDFVKQNPKWKISLQTHKLLNIR